MFEGHSLNSCYVKVIVLKTEGEKVIGYHMLSPNSGDITQGIAIAMKCGVTAKQLFSTVGIHPTVGEVIQFQ